MVVKERGLHLSMARPFVGPTEHGIVPATGSLTAPIELSTGRKAYYVGKPNPLIMRHAMLKLGAAGACGGVYQACSIVAEPMSRRSLTHANEPFVA